MEAKDYDVSRSRDEQRPAPEVPEALPLPRRASEELSRSLAEPLESGLYLVATPIGNLADITLRALSVLCRADVVYCEDTRHSAKLLHHYAISGPVRPFHEHNEDAERTSVLKALAAGRRVALISDAGTPLVSDPGFKLVRAAVAEGHPVFSIPGPSAVLTALASSGLPTDAFFFAGFLPPKQAARRARLAELRDVPGTLIVFEAPQRTAESLGDMAEVLGDRPGVVARELTKLHEELARGPLSRLAADMGSRDLKGEVVIIAGPPLETSVSDAAIEARLAVALETLRLKDAAAAVAETLGVSKGRVYDLGIRMKDAARRD